MGIHGTYYDFGNMESHSESQPTVPQVAIPRTNDHDAKVYNSRGIRKAKLGEYESAIVDFNMALNTQPGEAVIYYNRGLAKSELGQYESAIADFDMAISMQPDFAFAYNNNTFAKMIDEIG